MNTEDMLDLSHEFEMAKMQIELRQVSDPDVLREMCIQLIGIIDVVGATMIGITIIIMSIIDVAGITIVYQHHRRRRHHHGELYSFTIASVIITFIIGRKRFIGVVA